MAKDRASSDIGDGATAAMREARKLLAARKGPAYESDRPIHKGKPADVPPGQMSLGEGGGR